MIVSQVVDQVRMRHAAFRDGVLGEGVIVGVIDTRQRSLLLQYGGAVDGLMSTSVTLAVVIGGALVGQSNGVPIYLTTYEDGWPVGLGDDGFPFVDFAQPKIAGDPFGEHGGVPGFPLPTDFLKLISVTQVDTSNVVRPVNIIAERARLERTRINAPSAFVSGNRLVPVRPMASGNSSDAWSPSIVSVELSYVALPALTSLADTMILPAVLMEPLISGVVESLALSLPAVSTADKRSLSEAARRAEADMAEYASDIVNDMQDSHVQYRG